METISSYLLTFLANSLWQIPLVTGVAWIVARLLRNGPASYRHAVWVSALVAAVLLPAASVRKIEPAAPLRIDVAYAQPTVAVRTNVVSASAVVPATPESGLRNVSLPSIAAMTALACYFAFLLFRLAQLGRAAARTLELRRSAHAQESSPLLDQVWTRCRSVFQLRGVNLLWSRDVESPMVTGKVVVLPESLLTETSEDVLTTAIGHEMAHIARRDFALNIVYEMLLLPVSFQPVTWIIRREIARTRELACDELVTRELMDARVYARSIVDIAAAMTAIARPGYTLGVFDGDILEERIRRLIAPPLESLKRARWMLAAGLATLAIAITMASGLALTARAQSGVREEMTLAAHAYNSGDIPGAILHFETAVRTDPANIDAKLFLANALLREHSTHPDNALLDRARLQYIDVLAANARHKLATQGLVAVSMNAKHLTDAHEWAVKLIALDPQDKTSYYTAAVIDWAIVYPQIHPSPDRAAVVGLNDSPRVTQIARIDEGLRMLEQALAIDPQYSDAMAYMNLLYRSKASLAESPSDAADLTAKADDWVKQALASRHRVTNAAAPPLNIDGPAPGPGAAHAFIMAPPPPPPPPPTATFAPQIVSQIQPVYTESALAEHIQGAVTISVDIAADGSVTNPKVVKSLRQDLDENALAAVAKWKFKPALRDGQPTVVHAQLEVNFKLKE